MGSTSSSALFQFDWLLRQPRRADAELSGQILTDKVTPHAGGRSYTVALENVTDIQRATETH